MTYLGDFALSGIVHRTFTSISTAGIPTSMAGSPAMGVKKNNATTTSTAGVTLITDLNGTTGLNVVTIDTSADATFYASGNNFSIEITAGTVNTNSVVGYAIGSFSINNRSSLRPTVAGRTVDISVGGEAGIDLANIGSPTTVVDLSGLTIKNVDNAVPGVAGNVTGSVGSVTGNVGGNVVGSVASVVAAVTISAASVQAIWDALTSALTTVGSIGKLLVTNIDATISSRLASASYTAPPSAATIATAVWDSLTSALTTVGSIGKLIVTNLDALISSRAPSSTALSIVQWTNGRATNLDNLDVAVSTRLASGSYTAPDNAGIAAIKAKTDNLPSDPASDSQVNTRVSTAHFDSVIGSPAGASVSADVASVKSDTSAIKSKTDNLPSDPASNSHVTSEANLVIAEVEEIPINPLLNDDVRLNHLDADISSRLPTSSYVAPDNTSIATIKTNTDNLVVKKNRAITAFEFIMTDSVNHNPDPGLTVSVDSSIDGSVFAPVTNTPTEVGSGLYKINFTAADMNGDVITFRFTATGADTRFVTILTQE